MIGTVDLELEVDQVLADLEQLAAQPLLKGLRNMHIPDWQSAAFFAVLESLQERGLVYDLVVHPHTMADATAVIERFPGLSVVIEHAGWPEATSAQERRLWADGMARLADLGSRISCKLSGIAMFTHSTAAADMKPWIDSTIESFGIDRCMIGSNFPVDGVFGSFDDYFEAYLDVIGAHGDHAVEAIFANTAERVYGI